MENILNISIVLTINLSLVTFKEIAANLASFKGPLKDRDNWKL